MPDAGEHSRQGEVEVSSLQHGGARRRGRGRVGAMVEVGQRSALAVAQCVEVQISNV